MSFDFDIDAEEDWFFNTDPICDFPNFKKSLTDMGIQIGTAGAWRSVGTVDVLPEDIGERILFEDGGIFYIDDEGIFLLSGGIFLFFVVYLCIYLLC